MAIHHRDDFACVYCGAHGGRLTLDHVGPVLRGGAKGSSAALVTACLSVGRYLARFRGRA